jgi:hypothetical protein
MSVEAISQAIRILCDRHDSEDAELTDLLVAEGLEREYAARLISFVPVVFARILLSPLGAKFSRKFRRSYGQGCKSADQLLESDSVWREVRSYAESNIGRLSAEERLWIAGRSPELGVINQALNAGLEVANQVLSPLVVWWPEQ